VTHHTWLKVVTAINTARSVYQKSAKNKAKHCKHGDVNHGENLLYPMFDVSNRRSTFMYATYDSLPTSSLPAFQHDL